MAKFRKKPVVIDAVRWMSDMASWEELKILVSESGTILLWNVPSQTLIIPTLEGEMAANNGDWIIKGIKGELYPCKPDIFDKTYEPV
jgi:hypothetical protein